MYIGSLSRIMMKCFMLDGDWGNRLYRHISEKLSGGVDESSGKLKRIREARLAGFEVTRVAHHFGCTLILGEHTLKRTLIMRGQH